MIEFVNAKINIGLQIVRCREDGYHDLQTIFYPVGLHAGSALNPVQFCDLLEIQTMPAQISDTPASNDTRCKFKIQDSGNRIDCTLEKNLVWKAANAYFDSVSTPLDFAVSIHLDKHLPDGAGMGGGSADAAFTLRMLRDLHCSFVQDNADRIPDNGLLADLALRLGADCPFFLYNTPCYAEGVGEKITPVKLDLSGYWLAVVKPGISISTKEAFAGVVPKSADFDLRNLPELPLAEWKNYVKNDFEDSIFPRFPEFPAIKQALYKNGAIYASLTGSGSCLYGIYQDEISAQIFLSRIKSLPTICATYLLKL